MIKRVLIILVSAYAIMSCNNDPEPTPMPDPLPAGATQIPSADQDLSGSSDEGWTYLTTGGYIGSGIPYDLYTSVFNPGDNLLNRTGDNEPIPYGWNAFTDESGVKLVGGLTCFGCHSGEIDGEYILGLGGANSDFTTDQGLITDLLRTTVITVYGEDSPEYRSFEPFYLGTKAVAPHSISPMRGVNPAFRIEEAAVAHRDPSDMSWLEEPYFEVPSGGYSSDVPPLWHVKKKNGLYYTGMGRGDYTKLLQQVMVVAIDDQEEAERIHDNFDDVLAWIMQLDAPTYRGDIDSEKANRGKALFERHCASCHGNYDTDEYPNLLIDLETIGTDPHYAQYFLQQTDFINWVKESWIGEGSLFDEYLAAPAGYIAPPLDGIWATAPYLHNGSIPTLDDLLHSPGRPELWSRDHDDSSYDHVKVGWPYEVETEATSSAVYDTRIEGYGNQGHIYGDVLSDAERDDLIEYLKTL